MKITLTGVDIGLALARGDVGELLVILATVADEDLQQGGGIVEDVAARHNGGPYHAIVAPFLRQLADAIDGQSMAAGYRHPNTSIGA